MLFLDLNRSNSNLQVFNIFRFCWEPWDYNLAFKCGLKDPQLSAKVTLPNQWCLPIHLERLFIPYDIIVANQYGLLVMDRNTPFPSLY